MAKFPRLDTVPPFYRIRQQKQTRQAAIFYLQKPMFYAIIMRMEPETGRIMMGGIGITSPITNAAQHAEVQENMALSIEAHRAENTGSRFRREAVRQCREPSEGEIAQVRCETNNPGETNKRITSEVRHFKA